MDVEELLRGYSDEQYIRAIITVLVYYLCELNIIDTDDFIEHFKNNPKDVLIKTIQEDKKINKKEIRYGFFKQIFKRNRN